MRYDYIIIPLGKEESIASTYKEAVAIAKQYEFATIYKWDINAQEAVEGYEKTFVNGELKHE